MRGSATEDSDMDLLIVLEGKVKPGEEIDRMIEIITEINLRYNVLISVYPISEEDYKKVNSPLLINVRREVYERDKISSRESKEVFKER